MLSSRFFDLCFLLSFQKRGLLLAFLRYCTVLSFTQDIAVDHEIGFTKERQSSLTTNSRLPAKSGKCRSADVACACELTLIVGHALTLIFYMFGVVREVYKFKCVGLLYTERVTNDNQ